MLAYWSRTCRCARCTCIPNDFNSCASPSTAEKNRLTKNFDPNFTFLTVNDRFQILSNFVGEPLNPLNRLDFPSFDRSGQIGRIGMEKTVLQLIVLEKNVLQLMIQLIAMLERMFRTENILTSFAFVNAELSCRARGTGAFHRHRRLGDVLFLPT